MALLHRDRTEDQVDRDRTEDQVDRDRTEDQVDRDRTEDQVDNRLGDERLMGDPPVGGPATVEHDDHEVVTEKEVIVDRPSRTETFGLVIRTIIFTLAVVAVAGMALANPDDVAFDLEFEQYSTPLWAIITISAALGAIAGLMVRARSRRATPLRK